MLGGALGLLWLVSDVPTFRGWSVVWLTFYKDAFHGLYEAIPGFIAGMILTFGVSWLTSEKNRD